MILEAILVVVAFFAGQKLAPVEVRNVPVPINVPVPVACKEPVPVRPIMPTEQFAQKPDLHQFAKSSLAEIERRDGYEIELRGALVRCTAPIENSE